MAIGRRRHSPVGPITDGDQAEVGKLNPPLVIDENIHLRARDE
jgi:hypothetical protein